MANVPVAVHAEQLGYHLFFHVSTHTLLDNCRGSVSNACDCRLIRHVLRHAAVIAMRHNFASKCVVHAYGAVCVGWTKFKNRILTYRRRRFLFHHQRRLRSRRSVFRDSREVCQLVRIFLLESSTCEGQYLGSYLGSRLNVEV